MLPMYDVSLRTLSFACILSLSWFIVGVKAGECLPPKTRKSKSKRGQRRRKSNGGSVEIYVGNLSYDMTERELMKLFQKYGKVASGRLIKNRFNGKSKGFGFVEMNDRGQSAAAIKALHNMDVKGRKMVVNEAKSNARR